MRHVRSQARAASAGAREQRGEPGVSEDGLRRYRWSARADLSRYAGKWVRACRS